LAECAVAALKTVVDPKPVGGAISSIVVVFLPLA
jgi:hypothetical protein